MSERIGLVLSGGGARGAYETGVLSVLLPWLESRGQRPMVLVGTSIGAVNVGLLAARADQPAGTLLDELCDEWLRFGYDEVIGPTFSLRALPTVGRLALSFLFQKVVPYSLLPSRSLVGALARVLPDDAAIHRQVSDGKIDVCAVAATEGHTNRTVVFHDGGPSVAADTSRGIEYVSTHVTREHIRASAAIPVLFPAVKVGESGPDRWYFDGGTRLNTPLKPALALGASRLIVVGLNSIWPAKPGGERADLFDGASQVVQGLLVDPLVNDVETLGRCNELILNRARRTDAPDSGEAPPSSGPCASGSRRLIPYIFVAPKSPDAIGDIAQDEYAKHYSGLRGLWRCRDLALLGRLVGAGVNPTHGELFSYLFFAKEFASRLLELGRADAQSWIDETHDDGVWQHRRLDSPPARGGAGGSDRSPPDG